jgi:hypothetical protein
MSNARISRAGLLFTLLVFGALFLYCVHGAAVGDLYVPSRRGPGVSLRGVAAWLVVAAPVALCLALLIRGGVFEFRGKRTQVACELVLLFVGVALLLGGLRLGSRCVLPGSNSTASSQAACKS